MTSERVDAGGVSNIAQLVQSLPAADAQVRAAHRLDRSVVLQIMAAVFEPV